MDALGPEPAGVIQLQQLFLRIINLIVGLAFLSLIAVVFWGGFKLLMSSGEAKKVESGRETLLWGLWGLMFMVLGFITLRIIEAFTGVKVTQFCIGFPGGPNNCPS